MNPPAENPALLLIVSGPAGSGKTTLCDRLLAEMPRLKRIVTATSREPREGEMDGEDYYFFDREEFERRIEAGEFFEWARVHDRLYGCLKSEVYGKLERDFDLILNIDVQGAATFRRQLAEDTRLRDRFVSVFVTPDSLDEIRARLRDRGQNSAEEIERRLANAEGEIDQWVHYDYRIVSRDRESDFLAISSIYRAEKLRNRRKILESAASRR